MGARDTGPRQGNASGSAKPRNRSGKDTDSDDKHRSYQMELANLVTETMALRPGERGRLLRFVGAIIRWLKWLAGA